MILRLFAGAPVLTALAAPALAVCPGGGNCNSHGTCIASTFCACFTGYVGLACDQCAPNYYNYPTCAYCEASTTCNGHGTCTATGACACNVGFTGANCNVCAEGYYGASCVPCLGGGGANQCSGHGMCDDGIFGSGTCICNVGYNGPACQYGNATTCNGHGTANFDGTCTCFTGYAGTNCQFCAPSYYNYPACTYCLAGTTCNGHGVCSATGSCICNTGFTGSNCGQCAADYYNYPTCTYCLAATTCGGNGTCNASGGCNCFPGWTGANCATPVVPSITQWSSVRSDPGGDYTISLNPTAAGNGLSGPTVEPRQGGIRRILVHFNRSVTLVDPAAVTVLGRTTSGGSMGLAMSYIPSGVSMVDADTMQILFVAGFLPDQTCYEVTVGPAALAEGLLGDNNVSVRALVGDATGSGEVTLSDAIHVAMRAAAGASATASPQLDIDFSGGAINLADALAAKAQITSPARKALCP